MPGYNKDSFLKKLNAITGFVEQNTETLMRLQRFFMKKKLNIIKVVEGLTLPSQQKQANGGWIANQ